MDGPGVRKVPEGSGEQGKMEKTGCEIICGAPTTWRYETKHTNEPTQSCQLEREAEEDLKKG